jgi:uncharacterized protein
MPLDLTRLRQFALRRQFPTPTTLGRALGALQFVQADPIRAPARAQDLTLRHRVKDYRAGDVERRYPRLAIEEDFFVNYGLVSRELQSLMHPRIPRRTWTPSQKRKAASILDFVRERGVVHPRDVDAHFAHGSATNWFGGTSNISTQLLDGMLLRGMLRVARREGGTRVYAVRPPNESPRDVAAAMDTMIDVIVAKYAPITVTSLHKLAGHLCMMGVPQWRDQRAAMLVRAKHRLPSARIEGTEWFWPMDTSPPTRRTASPDVVRLLAPFDPFVWDRGRFELFNGWAYRFEAYTPAAKRVRGYYALPLLWRETVIGWGNLAVRGVTLHASLGYVSGSAPRDRVFRVSLDAELARFAEFIGATEIEASTYTTPHEQ